MTGLPAVLACPQALPAFAANAARRKSITRKARPKGWTGISYGVSAPTVVNGTLDWTGDVGFDSTVVVSFSVAVSPIFAGTMPCGFWTFLMRASIWDRWGKGALWRGRGRQGHQHL